MIGEPRHRGRTPRSRERNVRFPAELYDKILDGAEKLGVNPSELIRAAAEEYCAKLQPKEPSHE